MFPLEIRELQKFHIYELIFLFIFPKNPIFFLLSGTIVSHVHQQNKKWIMFPKPKSKCLPLKMVSNWTLGVFHAKSKESLLENETAE